MPKDLEYESDGSISSAVSSEQDPEKVYDVELVLAGKEIETDAGKEWRYLVKWEGYPIARSTWEPIESFTDVSPIRDWEAKKGTGQEFDWRGWDRDRKAEEEAREKAFRRQELARIAEERREKRFRTPARAGSSESLDDFVVDDDVVDDDEESDHLEQRHKRKRKGRSAGDDDGESGTDKSLVSSLKATDLTSKEKGTSKRVKYTEKPQGARQADTQESIQDRRKRTRTSPDGWKAATTQPEAKKTRGLFPLKKPGPSTRKRPGPGAAPRTPTAPNSNVFKSLGAQNRQFKKSRNEPPPDVSVLELFRPGAELGNKNRKLSMSLSSPSTTAPVTVDNRVGQNYSVPQNAGSSTVGDISRNSTFRKPYLPGSELVQSPRELRDNAIDSLFDYETSGKLTRGDTSDPAWSVAAPENPDSMDIDLAHSAPSGPLPSTRPPGFQCSLELGPVDAISYLGDATLLGFSEDFVEFLGIHKVHELWISKFFAQNYIENTLSKFMSSPIETADVAVDADSVQPLVTSLTYMKGAGVVIHDRFTILFFLPSNNQLKYAFKLPAMKNYPKLKIYLRLVVLPPLDVPVPVKAMLERAKPITSPLDSGFDWYHHNLLHRSTGVKFDEIIERDKENMRRMRDSGMFFVFYCPPNVQLEQMEISHAIALYNKKVLKIDEIPGFLDGSRGPLRLTVMIHQSLRRQLHLLPHINRLRNKTNFQFHLFGTKVEGNRVLTNQLRIWPLGAVIFITPRLATSFPDVLDHILNYQRLKSTTTKLALPSNWEPQFMETLEMNGQAKRLIDHINILKDKISKNHTVEIQVEDFRGCDYVETMVDRFVYYQFDACLEFRRFIFAHVEIPDSVAIDRLYTNTEFYDTDSIITQLGPNKTAAK